MTIKDLEEYNDHICERQTWGSRVVFTATCVLALVSTFGTAAAISIYIYQVTNIGVDACQVLLICSSAVSLIFVGLYGLAARRNDAVGAVRPPSKPWHNACFVALRVGLLAWIATIAATFAIALEITCSEFKFLCLMQKLEGGLSIGGLLTSIIILSLLEKCPRPFTTPRLLQKRRKVSRRVSSFAEDLILERSVSHGRSCDANKVKFNSTEKHTKFQDQRETETPEMCQSAPKFKSYVASPQANDAARMPSWGSDWTTLLKEAGCTSDFSSQVSMSSSDFGNDRSFNVQKPRRVASRSSVSSAGDSWGSQSTISSVTSGKSRKAAPSSSISDTSHRSPLSVMRTVEQPDVPYLPELSFVPVPGSSPSPDRKRGHKRTSSKPNVQQLASHSKSINSSPKVHLVSVPSSSSAHSAKSLPRLTSKSSSRPSPEVQQRAEQALGPHVDFPVRPLNIPTRKQQSQPLVRRNTNECHIPGAFDSRPLPEADEDALDFHTRVIEEAIFASAKKVELTRIERKPISTRGLRPNQISISVVPPEPSSTPYTQRGHKRHDSAAMDEPVVGGRLRRSEHDDMDEDIDDSFVYQRVVSEKSPKIPELRLSGQKLWEV